jgi:hypothetical protein
MRGVKKSGQVWVETVIYTLIALLMITAVLAYAKPKLESMQDEAVIKQSIEILKEIDLLVLSAIQGGVGNKRTIDIGIKKGVLKIQGDEDIIMFVIESRNQYSQPNEIIEDGNLFIKTVEKGKGNEVSIWRDYSGKYDITYSGEDVSKQLSKSSQPYHAIIAHVEELNDMEVINFEID